MEKPNIWKKRIILAGMMATIPSLSLTGCVEKKKEKVSNMKMADSEISEKVKMCENANGEWKNYKNIVDTEYIDNNTGELCCFVMGVEERRVTEKNIEIKYNSLSMPDVYLIETQNLKDYSINYKWEVSEDVDFSEDNKVLSIAYHLGSSSNWTFKDVTEYEKLIKQEHLEINNLGR